VPFLRWKEDEVAHLEPTPLNPSLAAGEAIERRTALSAADFMANYALKNKPVILTDAFEGCRALERWTPEFFANHYGDRQLQFFFGKHTLLMKDFIHRVLESSAENPAPYWTNAVIEEYFSELLEDLEPLPPYLQPNWALRFFLHPGIRSALSRGGKVELYVGGPGGKFPVVHWDSMGTHAFLLQVYGLKQYWAWPPSEDATLYPRRDAPNLSDIPDVEQPDLEKYPLFNRARTSTFVLKARELLFVPARWWHTAKILSPSITVSFNVLNRSNWNQFKTVLLEGTAGLPRVAKAAYLAAELTRHTLWDFISGI
jgi:histone arginine demethylase JMJD6